MACHRLSVAPSGFFSHHRAFCFVQLYFSIFCWPAASFCLIGCLFSVVQFFFSCFFVGRLHVLFGRMFVLCRSDVCFVSLNVCFNYVVQLFFCVFCWPAAYFCLIGCLLSVVQLFFVFLCWPAACFVWSDVCVFLFCCVGLYNAFRMLPLSAKKNKLSPQNMFISPPTKMFRLKLVVVTEVTVSVVTA